ncbi:hypothetical protein RND71_006716 [Anisodus tanguticus]|uniref:Uncharacterized protein n=1 Tax=Anisodus tanguticus TaxID=243964 RepID=A0AAE1SUE4_9SOLA|nr:hypothetical protein RND71_006716 [Anisodus tanguticus]
MESINHLTTTFSSNNQECEFELTHGIANSSASASCPIEVASFEEDINLLACDYFDGVLKYINQMLMEEDLKNRPCMLQDSLALQATEKSFYDALSADQQLIVNYEGPPSSKYLASCSERSDQTELYDTTLLCSSKNPGFYSDPPCCQIDHSTEEKLAYKPLYVQSRMPKRGRPRAGAKRVIANAVDLWSLLTQCAQAMANYETRTPHEKLNLIRYIVLHMVKQQKEWHTTLLMPSRLAWLALE